MLELNNKGERKILTVKFGKCSKTSANIDSFLAVSNIWCYWNRTNFATCLSLLLVPLIYKVFKSIARCEYTIAFGYLCRNINKVGIQFLSDSKEFDLWQPFQFRFTYRNYVAATHFNYALCADIYSAHIIRLGENQCVFVRRAFAIIRNQTTFLCLNAHNKNKNKSHIHFYSAAVTVAMPAIKYV